MEIAHEQTARIKTHISSSMNHVTTEELLYESCENRITARILAVVVRTTSDFLSRRENDFKFLSRRENDFKSLREDLRFKSYVCYAT